MKKSEFARLCQITPPMISKYDRAGKIAHGPGGVDALKSLQRLAGHLDEGKRTAAILALADGLAAPPAMPVTAPAPGDHPPADEAPALDGDAARADIAASAGRIADLEKQKAALQAAIADQSEKRRREKIEADLKELEYLRAVGKLVSFDDSKRALDDIGIRFWTEVTRREREDADIVSAALGLDQVRAQKLRNLFRERMNRLRQDFADSLTEMSRRIKEEATKSGRPAA